MGAYENPNIIVDKSAEILTQGFLQASEAIGKGIVAFGAGLGEKGKAEEKRRQELQDQRTSHYAKVGIDVLKELQDTAKELAHEKAMQFGRRGLGIDEETELTEITKYKPEVQSHGRYNTNNVGIRA